MKLFAALLTVMIVLSTGQLLAQPNTTDLYMDYQKYFSEVLQLPVFQKAQTARVAEEIRDSAVLIKEERPVAAIIPVKQRSKQLDGASIFSSRRNSVFILGKLLKRKPGAGVDFDLTGTAFAVTEDGVCATNYHVLKELLVKGATNDSVYFVLTADKNIYFIDKILAYSQNNDVALFKVQTNGKKMIPIPFGGPAPVGTTVYCLSNPVGFFYYFSRGMVARNIIVPAQQAAAGYNPAGKPPLRMEITADYGVGSSGGPILDQFGNMVGMVSSTIPLGSPSSGAATGHQQMVVKDAIPVVAIRELLKE
ncbi:S1 family peptidase [Niabella beijingensis]|uniref:S1 family peptidase n=1 Tax=Niabella beijingensis TaxID=2872700 RepID=UPI001CBF3D6C|nr:serine protease [Niabella beijingensis]MBZ4189387.1 serine protease [Niabella beijingensis]